MNFKPAIFIYFDGSYKRFNNKYSIGSIGYYVETQGGDKLFENNCIIPSINSNTEAEYKSLELALKDVLKKYGENNRVFVFGDEKTIINQLKLENKNNEYKQTIKSILKLKNKFEYVIFTHISQHENKKAHRLSNSML